MPLHADVFDMERIRIPFHQDVLEDLFTALLASDKFELVILLTSLPIMEHQ